MLAFIFAQGLSQLVSGQGTHSLVTASPRLEEYVLLMPFEIPPLPLCKCSDINSLTGANSHTLEGGRMSYRGYEHITCRLETDKSTVEQVIYARGK